MPGAGTGVERRLPSNRGSQLHHPHLRVPDERARLRADGRAARGRRLRARRRIRRPPTSSCSTPARSGRTPTTSSTATSGTCARRKLARPGHADRRRRLPGPEGPRRRSCAGRRGWTSCSARTTCGALPVLLERARHNAAAQVEIARVARGVPVHAAGAARVGLRRLGVDLRGLQQHLHVLHRALAARHRARPPARATCSPRSRRWPPTGVLEVTLLGQNVNSYGVEFGDRGAFAKLLRACGDVAGLERVRFTSPHPRDFTSDVIAAMAADPERLPAAAHAAAVRVRRRAAPRCAARTGRPGTWRSSTRCGPRSPTRRSPRTSSSGSRARPTPTSRPRWTSCARPGSPAAFTFQYSPRPGTPAAALPDQLPKAVVQERYERLVALQEEISWAQNRALRGPRGRGAGRDRRGPQGRRHPAAVRAGPRRPAGALRAGRMQRCRPGRRGDGRGDLRRAAPPRRRRSACWPTGAPGRATRTRRAAPTGTGPGGAPTGLGLPGFGPPAPLPAVTGCAVGTGGGAWLNENVARGAGRPGRRAGRGGAPRRAPDRPGRRRRWPWRWRCSCCWSRCCCPGPASAPGWQVLAGLEPFGPLPRLFTVHLAAVRGARLGAGAGHAVVGGWPGWPWGCGFSVVHGVWAIWSRQVGVPARRHRPGDRHGARGDRDGGAHGGAGCGSRAAAGTPQRAAIGVGRRTADTSVAPSTRSAITRGSRPPRAAARISRRRSRAGWSGRAR